MATTTWSAIRDTYVTAIVALTPGVPNGKGNTFERCPKRYELRKWALEVKGSATFRKFEFVRSGAMVQAGHLASSEKRVLQAVTLLVAYPTDMAFYGKNEIEDLEKVIQADASQLHDTLFSAGNFTSGQSVQNVQVQDLDRGNPDVWFQRITVDLVYTIAMDLSF